jgi:hypothetical protein
MLSFACIIVRGGAPLDFACILADVFPLIAFLLVSCILEVALFD